MEETFSDEINEHLLEGEKVLWAGKPNSKVIFYYVFVGVFLTAVYGCGEIFTIISGLNFF